MPQTALNNVGLNYEWNAGEDGWKAGVDRNFVLTDAWTLPNVLQVLNAQPGSPGAGDAYIIGPAATGAEWAGNDNRLAVWDGNNSAWVISAPLEGWRVYDQNSNIVRQWDGTKWAPIWNRDFRHDPKTEAGTTYTFLYGADSLNDGDAWRIIRFTNVSQVVATVDTAANEAFEIGTEILAHAAGVAGTIIRAAAGVTFNGPAVGDDSSEDQVYVNQGETAKLIKVAANTWEVHVLDRVGRVVLQAANITLDGSHHGATIELDTSAAARDVTIPQESAERLPDGFECYIVNDSGSNAVTFTTTGLTTRGIASLPGDRDRVRIVKAGTDTFISG